MFNKGHSSKVYKAMYNGKEVAVKKYKEKKKSQQKERFLIEGFIPGNISHPNIIEFIGIVMNKKYNMIVTEFVEGKNSVPYAYKINTMIVHFHHDCILSLVLFLQRR